MIVLWYVIDWYNYGGEVFDVLNIRFIDFDKDDWEGWRVVVLN